MARAERIKIVEVGPRDGLQNEDTVIPASLKIDMIQRLAEAGLPVIETGAFVSADWVPQMADTADVMKGLKRKEGVRYPVLIPNIKGLRSSLEVKVKDIAVFASASESFSMKNINCSIEESFNRFEDVMDAAGAEGLNIRGYVSCALGCPYEGEIEASMVARVAERLYRLGCSEISIADTTGKGTPDLARHVIETCAESVPIEALAVHFHDTYGQALANILAVLDLGIATIDSSVAGLGGCPYAQGASGNVATEDVVYMLDGLGIETGVDLKAVAKIGGWISSHLKCPHRSRAGRAILAV